MIPDYREVLGSLDGKKGRLRRGITTGTCATAAAKAAATALLSGNIPETVVVRLPASKKAWARKLISVPVVYTVVEDGSAQSAVVKDGGDDYDSTNGTNIVATVRFRQEPGIIIQGGQGVGIATRPGLPVPMGSAAINPTPMGTIRAELEELLQESHRTDGLEVLITVPEGESLAKKTWNPRIGIQGGISIIGTNGVVEPASSAAFRKSIYRTAKAFAVRGLRIPTITPGYVGERYLKKAGIQDDAVLVVGDHIGFALDACARLRFQELNLTAHIGKLVKVAAGIFNTHARYGDARLETLAAHAGAAGADSSVIKRILALKLAEEAVSLLLEKGLGETFTGIAKRASERATERCGLPVACTALDLKGNILAVWPPQHQSPQTEPGLTVVGAGPGPVDYLLPAAEHAVNAAAVLAGDERHLALWRDRFPDKKQIPFTGGIAPFLDAVENAVKSDSVALLVSGDPGLYSMQSAVRERFGAGTYKVIPGLSSFQLACIRFGISYDDAELHSVHGRPQESLESITGNRTAIIFCDSVRTPALVARNLMRRMDANRRFLAAERLGYDDERLEDTSLQQASEMHFGGLCIAILPGTGIPRRL